MTKIPRIPYKSLDCEEFDLKLEVETSLPKEFECRVFKVISNHTGNAYWLQLVTGAKTEIVLCDCPTAKFLQPLEVLGLAKDLRCKHAKSLLESLK